MSAPRITPLLKIGQKPPLVVLSDGLGQDSAALRALLLDDPAFRKRHLPDGADLLIVTGATGNEHQETDEYRARVEQLCRERDVQYLHVTPDLGFHSPAWQNLHTQWERNFTVQSTVFPRTCSVNLKIAPIFLAINRIIAERYGYAEQVGRFRRAALYAYERDYGKLNVMIGFSKGEERRIKPPPSGYMADTIHRTYPLIDLGLDRLGCQTTTRTLGHEVPFPSNCQNCPFHTKMDLVRLHRKAPASFDLWAHYEHRKLTSPKWAHTRNHTVFGNNLTLHENLEIGMKTYGTLSTEELDALRMTRGHRNTTGF